MKKIIIIIDGMEDLKYNELNNKTPLEYADTKNIDKMHLYKYMSFTPQGMIPDSMNCILNIIGVKQKYIPFGRSYIEAVANNIDICDNDLILRCNCVNVDENGILKGNSNTIIKNDVFKGNNKFKIYNINGYRNIIVIKDSKKYAFSLKTFLPHQNIGKKYTDLLPYGNDIADELNQYCNNFIPWSPSFKSYIPSFKSIYNNEAAFICCADIVKGIAYLMNIICPNIIGATADIDTNLNLKAEKTLEFIYKYKYVFVHINGADEASHRMNLNQKINFIENIDKQLIKYLIENSPKDTEITLLSDHACLCVNGSHNSMPVAVYKYRKEF